MLMMSGFSKGAKKEDTNLQPSFMEMTIKYFMFNSLFSLVHKKHGKDNRSNLKKMISKNRRKNTVNDVLEYNFLCQFKSHKL